VVDATQELGPAFYESMFHTLTIEYSTHADINWPGVLGHVKALQGKCHYKLEYYGRTS
jgi:hypothetical protein